jgi:Flp pilus assembly protein TadG
MRRLWRRSEGTVALNFAIAAIPLMGLALFGLDAWQAVSVRTNLQVESDAAVLAAASIILADPDRQSQDLEGRAEREVEKRVAAFVAAAGGHVKMLGHDVAVDLESGRVKLKVDYSIDMAAGRLLGIDVSARQVTAAARALPRSSPVCILALAMQSDKGIEFRGDGDLKASECVVWSNADGFDAITFNGKGKVTADRLCAVGEVGSPGLYKVEPPPESDCQFIADPMSAWTPPNVGSCTETSTDWIVENSTVLKPGVYCGGLRVDSKNIHLQPGIYVIKNGPLVLRGSARISGKDVGIFLTGAGAEIDIDGKAKVDLRADTTGAMAGIIFALDKASVTSGQSRITGASDLKIGGVIYLPTQRVIYTGESDTQAASPVTTLIADTIEVGGDAFLEVKNDRKKAKYAPIVSTGQGSVFLEK